MVFGWGKKKEEVQQTPESRSIGLDEVPSVLDEAVRLRTQTLVQQTNRFVDRINPAFAGLKDAAGALDSDKPKKDQIDKRVLSVLQRSRRQVIYAIRTNARSDFARIESYADAAAFGKALGRGLKMIGDALGKQSKIMHDHAKKHADRMKSILTELNSDKDEVFELIRNYEKADEARTRVLGCLEQLAKIRELESAKSARIATLSESLEAQQADADKISGQIGSIKSDAKYAKYTEAQKRLAEFEETRGPIKSDIDRQFTKISRPLGKYLNVCSEKERLPVLRGLVNSPIDVLVPENRTPVIEILQAVRKAGESGSISVKDVSKASQLIDETTETIAPFIERIAAWEEKRGAIRAELDSFDSDELRRHEQVLAGVQADIENLESRIKMLKDQVSESVAKIPGLISDIESSLGEISAVRYTVKR